MELDSEETTHCHLICCVYIKGHSGFFILMSRQLIQRIKAMLLCIVYVMLFVDTVNTKIKACNVLNCVCYVVCLHKDTGVCGSTYISAHNFLNIQQIFNPKKILESSD